MARVAETLLLTTDLVLASAPSIRLVLCQVSLTELTNPNPNPNQVSLLELTFPDDAALRSLGYGAFAVRDPATDYY